MKKYLKYLFSISILFICVISVAQKDTIRTKKRSVFASLSLGLPVYNEFIYFNDASDNNYKTANSEKKFTYNTSINFNLKRFTWNAFVNYCQNEFDGNSYRINGLELYTPSHGATVYKNFEIYQHIKYNQLQIGVGLGYNQWIKKGNLSITFNVMRSLFIANDITITSHYTKNSTYNDADTSKFILARNFKSKDTNPGFEIYGNLKISYSVPIYKQFYFNASLNASFGLLDIYSDQSSPEYNNFAFGYFLTRQKVITPSIGVGFRLK